jgi:hypothetical protein
MPKMPEAPTTPPDWYYDEPPELDEPDELEDAMMNCHSFRGDDGYWYCGAIGSEDCDECPFQRELGTRWRRRRK